MIEISVRAGSGAAVKPIAAWAASGSPAGEAEAELFLAQLEADGRDVQAFSETLTLDGGDSEVLADLTIVVLYE